MSPAPVRPPAPLRRRARLGKYTLERRLGAGGFASVWQARDAIEHRRVALKIAHPQVIEEWGRDAVEHEARIASRLHHPNIVAVRNADWIDGRFVMTSELARKSLDQAPGIRRSGPMALRVIREIAAALAYAHSKRVLHRDLKPENILLFDDRRAALTDFGVSRLASGATRSYTEAGTLGYMAPEQAYGRPKLCSDVFSFGLISYELLTNSLPTWPFDWPPKNYDRFEAKVPEPVQRVLRKAAEFEPAERYTDGVALQRALEKAFDEVAPKKPRRTRRTVRSIDPPSALSVESETFRKRHGHALGLKYHCHRCNGAISESMTHCPWCGSVDNSFREVTTYPMYCPDCERGIRPEWNYCPWCYAGRFESNGRPPRPDPDAVRDCSRRNCEGELQHFMRYCPQCKQKPKRVWSHDALPDRCPRCRWSVSHTSWRFCPWCGRREPRAGMFG
jgi:serine/threonine protein kinase